ncbi:transporter substrate-binding domain-containing protein [Candidatus Micrarchaeota archaeon]|nr:transporter substrate-binding domain-containing protein [Candidatus Micrarchaeota archaeon]
MRTAGMGAAALGAATMGMSGVARAGNAYAYGLLISETLKTVKKRGKLLVGIGNIYQYYPTGYPPYFYKDANGQWIGFEPDLGRCIATAVMGSKDSVEIVGSQLWDTRFTDLANGMFDVLFAQATWTLARDLNFNDDFGPVYEVTPVTFWVRNANPASWSTLRWAAPSGTTGADYAYTLGGGVAPMLLNATDAAYAYMEGGVDAFITDEVDTLAFLEIMGGSTEAQNYQTYKTDPLAIVVRENDSKWHEIVNWVGYALIQAAAWGWTQGNIESIKNNPAMLNDSQKRFLGLSGEVSFMTSLGLNQDWAYQVIKQNGNYLELRAKWGLSTTGPNTPEGLGGVLFTPVW